MWYAIGTWFVHMLTIVFSCINLCLCTFSNPFFLFPLRSLERSRTGLWDGAMLRAWIWTATSLIWTASSTSMSGRAGPTTICCRIWRKPWMKTRRQAISQSDSVTYILSFCNSSPSQFLPVMSETFTVLSESFNPPLLLKSYFFSPLREPKFLVILWSGPWTFSGFSLCPVQILNSVL